MTTIGHFRRDGEGFVGRLTTVGLDATLRLVPAEKFSSKAPDYLVLVGETECGAAWRATDASGALLNLKLDDPAWPEPGAIADVLDRLGTVAVGEAEWGGRATRTTPEDRDTVRISHGPDGLSPVPREF